MVDAVETLIIVRHKSVITVGLFKIEYNNIILIIVFYK